MTARARKDPSPAAGLLAAALLAILTALLVRRPPGFHPAAAWLTAVSAVTFLAFGTDKLLARWGAVRVPERILLLLALAGGVPAAYLAMELFRHKTVKTRFRRKLLPVLLLQAGLVAAWYLLVRPLLDR